MQALSLGSNTTQQTGASISSIVSILKYLHILIYFTALFYIQFTFNGVHLQAYGSATMHSCFLSFFFFFLNNKTFFQTKSLKRNCKATHF